VRGLLLFLLQLLPKHKRRRFFLAEYARQNNLLLRLSLFWGKFESGMFPLSIE
jgi:hypothetical protein